METKMANGFSLKEYEKPRCNLLHLHEEDVVRTSANGTGLAEVGEQWSEKWNDGSQLE